MIPVSIWRSTQQSLAAVLGRARLESAESATGDGVGERQACGEPRRRCRLCVRTLDKGRSPCRWRARSLSIRLPTAAIVTRQKPTTRLRNPSPGAPVGGGLCIGDDKAVRDCESTAKPPSLCGVGGLWRVWEPSQPLSILPEETILWSVRDGLGTPQWTRIPAPTFWRAR
jgi:hypothetical protein